MNKVIYTRKWKGLYQNKVNFSLIHQQPQAVQKQAWTQNVATKSKLRMRRLTD